MTRFFFDGRACDADAGDTVASALYRAGRRVFSRSFKYHRPRGLLCVAGRCPNCLVDVDGTPNVRACTTPVGEGMRVRHQNATPSLEVDALSGAQRFSWLMPVGFYYKTFTTTRQWRMVEPLIRRVAGLGKVPHTPQAVPDRYEHEHARAEVAVIGGGPAGMLAAIAAASGGRQVVLVDDQPQLGGHLRYQRRADPRWRVAAPGGMAATQSGPDAARVLRERVEALRNVRVLTRATCFGLYEGNLLGIVQHRATGGQPPAVRERLIHLRAERIVVATGAYEVPILFRNNDVPGVMLSDGVQRLMNLHGIRVADSAVVVSTESGGGPVAADLRAAGIAVVAVVPPAAVKAAIGRMRVTGLKTTLGDFACDLVVVCGPWVPDAGLVAQAGGALAWDPAQHAFVPTVLPAHVAAAGGAMGAGTWRPSDARDGSLGAAPAVWPAPIDPGAFVCYCEDVMAKDVAQAVDEGFDHIETLKRYTTVTMGPCQGRMCQLASIGLCAAKTGRTIAETGVTTSRPPAAPVSLGALAGARHHPVRRTPMHALHDALGCTWMDMGEWKRPLYYSRDGGAAAKRRSVEAEYRGVRERVGVIDLSTLGKLDVKGTDAPVLLDKVYTNRISDLAAGRARYSVICDDAGIILDDGTISRLGGDHFFITTTTGNLEFVQQWIEWWTAGTGLCVHVTNVTGGYAAVNVAGPRARALLETLTDCDLRTRAFPYMACRQATVAGVPCILLRIGFVGETGWEIHFPAEYGEYLWDTLLDAGRAFGIQPFGVETQRVLRLEKKHVIVGVDTDATSNPLAADLAWVAKLDKDDFIGKAAILQMRDRAPREKLVGFRMDEDALPEDGAAILVGGEPLGRVTSARYSFASGAAVGMGWVPADHAGDGQVIEVAVDGRFAPARLVADAFYDPEGKRLRS